jgi:hypothetical protein
MTDLQLVADPEEEAGFELCGRLTRLVGHDEGRITATVNLILYFSGAVSVGIRGIHVEARPGLLAKIALQNDRGEMVPVLPPAALDLAVMLGAFVREHWQRSCEPPPGPAWFASSMDDTEQAKDEAGYLADENSQGWNSETIGANEAKAAAAGIKLIAAWLAIEAARE